MLNLGWLSVAALLGAPMAAMAACLSLPLSLLLDAVLLHASATMARGPEEKSTKKHRMTGWEPSGSWFFLFLLLFLGVANILRAFDLVRGGGEEVEGRKSRRRYGCQYFGAFDLSEGLLGFSVLDMVKHHMTCLPQPSGSLSFCAACMGFN